MIIFNFPINQPQQIADMDPKRRRLFADMHQIEQTLRVIDLEELQKLIDEQTKAFPAWSKGADPYAVRAVTLAITSQQIILLSAVEMWRARKELPLGGERSEVRGQRSA